MAEDSVVRSNGRGSALQCVESVCHCLQEGTSFGRRTHVLECCSIFYMCGDLKARIGAILQRLFC